MMSFEQPSQSLKRDHDSFTELDDLADLEAPFSVPTGYSQLLADQETQQKSIETTSEPRPSNNSSSKTKRHPSPTRSSSELTDAGPTTPPRDQSEALPSSAAISTSSAFVMLNASGGNSVATPATKKQKLTFQEKELRKINRDIKEKERAEEKARREVETQARAEEKARKEADRKKKEEEREAKRVALEAEKAAKEERRRKKEEEKHKAEEEKRKKERSQLKLGSFFIQKPARAGTPDSLGRTSMSPAPGQSDLEGSSATTLSASTPIKNEGLYYEKLFPSFFVKDGVTLAPTNRWERDEQATESSLKMIDAHLGGKKHMNLEREFNAAALFHLPSDDHTPRGIRYLPVREIMARFRAGNPSRPIDLTTESQNTQIKRTGDLLRKIPLKFLKFQEDVRPPYKGTYTNRPISGMSKLARNPMMRDLPDKNYDYDSEAEWIEDEDEDGEDLKSDGDEDEELNDDADDMDGFLDDEADDLANSRRRFVVQEDLEPISSGLCWEDRSKRTTNAKMMKYRMEMIKGELQNSNLGAWLIKSRPDNKVH